MPQGFLPFKYEEEKKENSMTALGGLPVYLDMATVMGIGASIEQHLHIKQQGWTDKREFPVSLCGEKNMAGRDQWRVGTPPHPPGYATSSGIRLNC